MRIGGKRNEPRAWLSARVHETGRSHLHPEYVRRKKVSRIKFEKGANRWRDVGCGCGSDRRCSVGVGEGEVARDARLEWGMPG